MAKKAKANSDSYLRMYSQMAKIRAFEDRANQLYLDAKDAWSHPYVFGSRSCRCGYM